MNKIDWICENVEMPKIDIEALAEWIGRVVKSHDRILGPLVYIFCDDNRIIEVTVATNAELVNASYDNELLRVIIHGVLHLCGINDKGPGEREIMEQNENEALAMLRCDDNN